MWMTKYCLNMMMKTSYIQWSSIARTWFSQNATTRSMTKNCWSLFAVWNINVLNWNVQIFQSRSSLIIWIWSTLWSLKNWSNDKLNELRSYLNITSRSYISWENRIWKSTCWSVLRAYQGWIELVSVSSSDLTQSLFSLTNISLFNIIFLSTSHSTHVTNTFSSSLAQSLNIT